MHFFSFFYLTDCKLLNTNACLRNVSIFLVLVKHSIYLLYLKALLCLKTALQPCGGFWLGSYRNSGIWNSPQAQLSRIYFLPDPFPGCTHIITCELWRDKRSTAISTKHSAKSQNGGCHDQNVSIVCLVIWEMKCRGIETAQRRTKSTMTIYNAITEIQKVPLVLDHPNLTPKIDHPNEKF